jgi:hypothetical protein
MRVNNLEFIRNRNSLPNRDPEMVAYDNDVSGKEFKYTLLFWKKNKEGWQVEFVGGRPMDINDRETLWYLLEYGQAVLDAEFRLLEYTKL